MPGLHAVANADIHGHDLVMTDRIVAAPNADDAGAFGDIELGRTRVEGQVVEIRIDRQNVVAGTHFHFGLEHLELGRIAGGQHFGARHFPKLIANDVALLREEVELALHVDGRWSEGTAPRLPRIRFWRTALRSPASTSSNW